MASAPTLGTAAPVTVPAGAVVGAGAGAVAGKLAGEWITNRLFSDNDGGSGGGEAKPERLPGETSNFNHAVKKLGLDKNKASDALHDMKQGAGLKGADNVWINTETGAVRAQVNGEVIGNLLH